MSWRPHGRASTNVTNPSAYAICDRCGRQFNRSALTFQHDWAGPRLMNFRILVCQSCLDVPFEHHRPIIVPPDPMPVRNPRPDLYRGPMRAIVADTEGREIDDTGGEFSFVTAPEPREGSIAGSITPAMPPPGVAPTLRNAGMHDWAFDTQGIAVRDTAAALVASPAPTTKATGVVTTQQMDGYMLRGDSGSVMLIPA